MKRKIENINLDILDILENIVYETKNVLYEVETTQSTKRPGAQPMSSNIEFIGNGQYGSMSKQALKKEFPKAKDSQFYFNNKKGIWIYTGTPDIPKNIKYNTITSCVTGQDLVLIGQPQDFNPDETVVGDPLSKYPYPSPFVPITDSEFLEISRIREQQGLTNHVLACQYWSQIKSEGLSEIAKSLEYSKILQECITYSLAAINATPLGCSSFFGVSTEIATQLGYQETIPEVYGKPSARWNKSEGSKIVKLTFGSWWNDYRKYLNWVKDGKKGELPNIEAPWESLSKRYYNWNLAPGDAYKDSEGNIEREKLDRIETLGSQSSEDLTKLKGGELRFDETRLLPYTQDEFNAITNLPITKDGEIFYQEPGVRGKNKTKMENPYCLKSTSIRVNIRETPEVDKKTSIFDIWYNYKGWTAQSVVGDATKEPNVIIVTLPLFECTEYPETSTLSCKRKTGESLDGFWKIFNPPTTSQTEFICKKGSDYMKFENPKDNFFCQYIQKLENFGVGDFFAAINSLGTKGETAAWGFPGNNYLGQDNPVHNQLLSSGVAKYWIELISSTNTNTKFWVNLNDIEPCRTGYSEYGNLGTKDNAQINSTNFQPDGKGNVIVYKSNYVNFLQTKSDVKKLASKELSKTASSNNEPTAEQVFKKAEEIYYEFCNSKNVAEFSLKKFSAGTPYKDERITVLPNNVIENFSQYSQLKPKCIDNKSESTSYGKELFKVLPTVQFKIK